MTDTKYMTIKQLEQRIADLEAQVEASTGDGWTYVEDGGLPSVDTPLELTIWDGINCEPVVEIGGYDSHPRFGGWFVGDGDGISEDDVIAWKLAPQPAPLRTAASEEGQNA